MLFRFNFDFLFGLFCFVWLFLGFFSGCAKATTYSRIEERAKKQVNFNIMSHTIELANKNALMPPPFNILVVGVTITFLIFDSLVSLLTGCFVGLNHSAFVGIDYSLFNKLEAIRFENEIDSSGLDSRTKNNLRQMSQNTQYASDADESLSSLDTDPTRNNTKPKRFGKKLFSIRKKRDRCKFNNPFSNEGKNYCRFCRNEMVAVRYSNSNLIRNANQENESKSNSSDGKGNDSKNSKNNKNTKNKKGNKSKKLRIYEGNIDDYFTLFNYYQLLDEADKKLIRNMLINRKLCPHCYRPYIYYNGKSNRLSRWQVLLELISYFVFRVFIWIPLCFILFLPALFSWIIHWFKQLGKSDYYGADLDMENNIYDIDPEYVHSIRDTIQTQERESGNNNDNGNNNNNNNTNNKGGGLTSISPTPGLGQRRSSSPPRGNLRQKTYNSDFSDIGDYDYESKRNVLLQQQFGRQPSGSPHGKERGSLAGLRSAHNSHGHGHGHTRGGNDQILKTLGALTREIASLRVEMQAMKNRQNGDIANGSNDGVHGGDNRLLTAPSAQSGRNTKRGAGGANDVTDKTLSPKTPHLEKTMKKGSTPM